MIVQKFSLEVSKNGVQKNIYAKKGEALSRTLSITLTMGGKVLDITGYALKIFFPDYTYATIENNGNPINYTLPSTFCGTAGEYVCELQLIGNDETEIFYSPQFRVIVEDSIGGTASAGAIGESVTYVEAQEGYSLMSDAEHTKLEGIESGAEVNVQADWSETDTTDDSYIQNKPTNVSAFTNDAGYLTQHQSLSGYVQEGDNVSVLVNDAGYLTEHQSLTGYLQTGDNVSALTNDAGYLTSTDLNCIDVVFTNVTISNYEITATSNLTCQQIYDYANAGKTFHIGNGSDGILALFEGTPLAVLAQSTGNVSLTFVAPYGAATRNFVFLMNISGLPASTSVTGYQTLLVITSDLDAKQNVLTAGTSVTIDNDTISASTEIYDDSSYIIYAPAELLAAYQSGTRLTFQNFPVLNVRTESGDTVFYYYTTTLSSSVYVPTIARATVSANKLFTEEFITLTTFLKSGDNVSELENDAGYLTEHQSLAGYLQSGDNVSELENDAGYLTAHQDISGKEDTTS